MATRSNEDLKSPSFWRALIAEFLGTLLFVFVGCASCALFDPEVPADVVEISLAFGLGVGTVVWATAHISGGHVNPAVTIGFWVTRKISTIRFLMYILAQCLGAISAAGILLAVSPEGVNDSLCTPMPSTGVSPLSTLLIEAMLAFILVLTVFATCDTLRGFAGSGPLAIGLAVAMCHLGAVPYEGSGMNPARVLGSALVSGYIDTIHTMYFVGPLIGGALAAILYDLYFAVNSSKEKAKALFTRGDYDDSQFDQYGNRVPDETTPLSTYGITGKE